MGYHMPFAICPNNICMVYYQKWQWRRAAFFMPLPDNSVYTKTKCEPKYYFMAFKKAVS